MFMSQTIEALAGDDVAPPVVDSIIGCYVDKLRLVFDDLLWRATPLYPYAVKGIIETYDKLSQKTRYRFFLSPEVYRASSENSVSIVERLSTLNMLIAVELQIEAGLENCDPFLPKSFLDDNDEHKWSLMARCALINKNGKQLIYHAPQAGEFIPLDFLSPWATAVNYRSGAMHTSPIFPSTEDIGKIQEKISWVLQWLDDYAPAYGRLVRNYARAIRIRKRQSENFASETAPVEIGAVRLLNPHADNFGHIELRDLLVHESVHHFLSTTEFIDGQFILHESDNRYRPVSPWSGRPIAVHSICHAIFVYYALFNLTLRELESNKLARANKIKALQRRNHYASGFMTSSIVDYVGEKSVIKDEVMSAFTIMQDDVQAKMRS